MGHAQKWLNMAFKYIYVMGEPNTEFSRHFTIYAPLDKILITALSPLGFQNLPSVWSNLNDYEAYLDRQRWLRHRFSLAPLQVNFYCGWAGRFLLRRFVLFQYGNPPEFVAAEQAQIVQDRLRGVGPETENGVSIGG